MSKDYAAGWPMAALALLVGVAGITVAWVAAAVLSGQPCSWMALVAAVDMAVLLRLTRAPAGALRTVVAVLATGLAVLLTHWMVAATQMGALMGMPPIASSLRLGPALAWQLMQLSLDRVDWILIASSLPLAGILTHVSTRPE